jgi:16S rRNA (guanine527-N7)-methyltransferase
VTVVSRETPRPPDVAVRVFGSALSDAIRYADLLVGAGVDRGLIGPRETSRIWDRHLLNCAVVAEGIPPGASVVDVGSGAGLPGLVLALVRPDLSVVLVEPLERRAEFLQEAVDLLGLPQVRVTRARAEELGPIDVDVVTARAVAPLGKLAGWCLPLLRPGGTLLALKGARAADELAAAEPVLRRLGATAWRIAPMGLDVLEHPTTVVMVTAGDPVARTTGRTGVGKARGRH